MWRAPLAGLASLAMVATMGVAASTANAADHSATLEGVTGSVNVWDGESLEDAAARHSFATLSSQTGYTLDGKAYNPATPLTGNADVKIAPAADTVPVTFNLKSASAQMVNGSYKDSATVLKVAKGAKIGDYFDVKDAANGKRVTAWELKDSGTVVDSVTTLAQVLEYPVASATSIEVTPKTVTGAATIKFYRPDNWNNNAHYVGSWTDKQAPVDGATLDLDGINGETLDAPTYVYTDAPVSEFDKVSSWADADGNTVELGGKFTVDGDAYFHTADKTAGADVTFDSNGGSYVKPQHVNAEGHVTKPADPTRDGYTFAGWKLPADPTSYAAENGAVTSDYRIIDFGGVTFNRNVTLTAQWTPTYDIRVTFHYGDYEGAPKDVTATYKPNDFLTEPETPTRAGYVFDGWSKPGFVNELFDFNNTLVANGATAANTNFVLTGVWHRAYADEALNALKYVQSKDFTADGLGRNDSAYFTDASWKAFNAEYKKAYQAYESAKHNAVNGEIDSKTAADVVNTLQAAWKDLRFSSANADTVLDGKVRKGATAKVIYRLNRLGGLHHLLSGDEKEVLSLSNANFGPGNWTRDETTFRTVNNVGTDDKTHGTALLHPEWVEGTTENANSNVNPVNGDKRTAFTPLLKSVTRLYNAQLQEHMYTSDSNEIAVLTAGDWTEDSNLASFYVPALYTTKTKVVRLYNPNTHLHLYTSDTNEVNVLTTKGGWTLDGDAASFYAL